MQLAVQPQSIPPTLWGESAVNMRSENLLTDLGVVKEDSPPQFSALQNDRAGLSSSASAVGAQKNPLENTTWKLNQAGGEEVDRVVKQDHELVDATRGNHDQLTGHDHRLDSHCSDPSMHYAQPEVVKREPAYISTTAEHSPNFPFDRQEFTNQAQEKLENTVQPVPDSVPTDPRKNVSESAVRATNVTIHICVFKLLAGTLT